jgi:nicotinate-nucleotide--dimethylbenzimidazole phosphoribosyltransferase
MMGAVEDKGLAAVAALVEVPPEAGPRSALTRRRSTTAPADDRLDELSAWWARVAGPTPPRRVEQFWLSRPSSAGPAQAQVRLRRFDAPTGIGDALSWAVTAADDAVDDGTDLILLSVPRGPRDVDWLVLAALLLGLDAVEALGWPTATGISDDTWTSSVARIRDGLRTVRGLREEPVRLLETLGSTALAAGTGLLLQAAARRTPVLLDGPAAAACALLASRITRAGRDWWLACDAGSTALDERILEELRLTPLLRLRLGDEDGTAARICLGLLETSIARALDQAQEPDDEPRGFEPGGFTVADDEPML